VGVIVVALLALGPIFIRRRRRPVIVRDHQA
jgi:hypothetical protein